MDLIFSFGAPVFLILLGLIVGRARERAHFRSIERREAATADVLVTQLKTFPNRVRGESAPALFMGEAVMATDYLKSFIARIHNIFGGQVTSYQTLLIRARREALLRIVEAARQQGYNAVCNVRFETADVGGNSTMRKVAMVAIIASATAYHAAPPAT